MNAASLPIPVLRETRWTFDLPVQGTSMEPLLREGDTVTVTCCPLDEVSEGDLICFQRGNERILHRVITKGADTWYEQGDAELSGQWINPDSVFGKATAINGEPLCETRQRVALRLARFEGRLRRAWPQRVVPRSMASLWRKWKANHT